MPHNPLDATTAVRRAVLVGAGLLLGALPAAAQVGFADEDFDPSDWTLTILEVGGGGDADASHEPTGGNPDAWRRLVVQPFAADADPLSDDGVVAIHTYVPSIAAPYDPALEGAVAFMSYREDETNPSSFGQGNAAGVAVIQDGVAYAAFTHITGTNGTWESHLVPRLRPRGFCRIAADAATITDCSQKPDLSEYGSPFSVGFARWNTTAGGGYTIVSGIDNWQLVVVPWFPLFSDDLESGTLDSWARQ